MVYRGEASIGMRQISRLRGLPLATRRAWGVPAAKPWRWGARRNRKPANRGLGTGTGLSGGRWCGSGGRIKKLNNRGRRGRLGSARWSFAAWCLTATPNAAGSRLWGSPCTRWWPKSPRSDPAKGGLDLVVGIVAVQFQGQRVRFMAGAQGNVHLVGGHLAQVGYNRVTPDGLFPEAAGR